ncbi:MAG: HIT family protein [Bacteroidales bacterium OttesenSCG-928-I14]|jgi:histidine triad (HIT) family protein|nr:HIT family protein [Bacteroidales bacterium OttesenSCG-928-I14]
MSTIFTKIIEGSIFSYKVAEDVRFYAFLDINPLTKGHVLVVSKKEKDYIFDLDDMTLAYMIVFAKKVSRAIEKVIDCKRVGLTVIGLEVPHAHIHLIPISKESDIYFSNPKKRFTSAQFQTTARAIASFFRIEQKQQKDYNLLL